MYRIFEDIGIFYALDTFIEIRRAVTWLATKSGWAQRKRPFAVVSSAEASFIFGQCCPCGTVRTVETFYSVIAEELMT